MDVNFSRARLRALKRHHGAFKRKGGPVYDEAKEASTMTPSTTGTSHKGNLTLTTSATFAAVTLDKLPGTMARHKWRLLQALPAVTAAKDRLLTGLGVNEAVVVKLDPEKMSEFAIAQPGRVVRDVLQRHVTDLKLTTASGGPIEVWKYTDETGAEVVVASDATQVQFSWRAGERKRLTKPTGPKKGTSRRRKVA